MVRHRGTPQFSVGGDRDGGGARARSRYLTGCRARRRVVPLPETQARGGRGAAPSAAHQAESLAAARRGEHLVVSTGTASDARLQPPRPRRARGRAEAGPLPLPDEGARAGPGPLPDRAARPAREAGDLRRGHRARAPLADPQVGERHPHQPRHAPHRRAPPSRPLGDVLANLRYVVVDEAHVYRGVFGSHVGNVLRRLRRAAQIYGASRSSCWPPPRSPTPASWPARCSASTPP